MKSVFLFLSLFLGMLAPICTGEGVIYCVKPSENSTCLHLTYHMCETLQYYFENVNSTINQQDNVTLMFTPGTHSVSSCRTQGKSFIISVAVVKMVGHDQNVIVTGTGQVNREDVGFKLVFSHLVTVLSVDNITFQNTTINAMIDTLTQKAAHIRTTHLIECHILS